MADPSNLQQMAELYQQPNVEQFLQAASNQVDPVGGGARGSVGATLWALQHAKDYGVSDTDLHAMFDMQNQGYAYDSQSKTVKPIDSGLAKVGKFVLGYVMPAVVTAGALGAFGAGAGAASDAGTGAAEAGAETGAGAAGVGAEGVTEGAIEAGTLPAATGAAGAEAAPLAATGGASTLSRVLNKGKTASALADVLGGAAGRAQGQSNISDTLKLGLANTQLARDKFATAAPGERLSTGIRAALAGHATPAATQWGGPGSGLRGEIPTTTGGVKSIYDALKDPNTQALSSLVGKDTLAAQQRGGTTGGGMDTSVGSAANVGRSSGADNALGTASLLASLYAGLNQPDRSTQNQQFMNVGDYG